MSEQKQNKFQEVYFSSDDDRRIEDFSLAEASVIGHFREELIRLTKKLNDAKRSHMAAIRGLADSPEYNGVSTVLTRWQEIADTEHTIGVLRAQYAELFGTDLTLS